MALQETAEQLTSVQLMIQETIQNVGKASKRAQAQELELQRRLSRATGLLEAKNSELAKLMSRLGGVVGKAELLKVQYYIFGNQLPRMLMTTLIRAIFFLSPPQ